MTEPTPCKSAACTPSLNIGELPEVKTVSPGADVVLVEGQGDEAQALRIPALAFSGEKGEKGDVGPANTLSVGSVATLPAGSPATASMTGTAPHQSLNLGLPQADLVGPLNTLIQCALKPATTGGFSGPWGNDARIGYNSSGDMRCVGTTGQGLLVNNDYSLALSGQYNNGLFVNPSGDVKLSGTNLTTLTGWGTCNIFYGTLNLSSNTRINGFQVLTTNDLDQRYSQPRKDVEDGVRLVSMGLASGQTLTADGKTYAGQLGSWTEGQPAPTRPASVFA